MKKSCFYIFALCACCATMRAATVFTHSTGESLPLCVGMSENHQYVVGTDELTRVPMLWDVEENEIIDWIYELNDTILMGGFNAVNNDGLIVGKLINENTTQSWAISADVHHPNEVVFLESEEGEYGSEALALSEDGKTIVGYYNRSFSQSAACIWKEGKRQDLPTPVKEALGFTAGNTKALYISSDAHIIAGGVEAENGYMVLITWTLDQDGNYRVSTPAKSFYGITYAGFKPMGLSKNGAWVLLQVKVKLAEGDWDSCDMPQTARLELSTGKLEVLGDPCDWTPWTRAIANDGTVVGYTQDAEDPEGDGFPDAVIWKAGQKDLTYLLTLCPDDEFFSQQTATKLCGITADGEYLMGYGGDAEANQSAYIVSCKDLASAYTPDRPVDPAGMGKFVLSPYESEALGDVLSLFGEWMSPNCKYVVGIDRTVQVPVAWTVGQEDVKVIMEPDSFYVQDTEDPEDWYYVYGIYQGSLHSVNNAGMAVGALESGFSDHSFAILYDIKSGTYTRLQQAKNDAGQDAYGITEDGSIIAGFHYDEAWVTNACIWTENGTKLTNLPWPSDDEAGFIVEYTEARGISKDGSVIWGFAQNDANGDWVAIHWTRQEDGSYLPHASLAKTYYTTLSTKDGDRLFLMEPKSMSENGQWMTLMVQREFDDWAKVTPAQAARLNLETGLIELLDDGETYATAPELFSISNDGVAVGRVARDITREDAVLWYPGQKTLVNLADMFSEDKYVQSWTTANLCYISAGGNYVMGNAVDEDFFMNTFYVQIDATYEPGYPDYEGFMQTQDGVMATKMMIGGTLVIIKNGVRYDVLGRPLR